MKHCTEWKENFIMEMEGGQANVRAFTIRTNLQRNPGSGRSGFFGTAPVYLPDKDFKADKQAE